MWDRIGSNVPQGFGSLVLCGRTERLDRDKTPLKYKNRRHVPQPNTEQLSLISRLTRTKRIQQSDNKGSENEVQQV